METFIEKYRNMSNNFIEVSEKSPEIWKLIFNMS
jgi:hypothetical protein